MAALLISASRWPKREEMVVKAEWMDAFVEHVEVAGRQAGGDVGGVVGVAGDEVGFGLGRVCLVSGLSLLRGTWSRPRSRGWWSGLRWWRGQRRCLPR